MIFKHTLKYLSQYFSQQFVLSGLSSRIDLSVKHIAIQDNLRMVFLSISHVNNEATQINIDLSNAFDRVDYPISEDFGDQ